jgi:predicted deacylase
MAKKILNTLIIDQQEISPGENKTLKLSVGRLPSGNKINVFAHVFRSVNPGPTVLVLAGIHGDEINGIEIARKSVENGSFENLQKGTVIAIPLLNIYGFINFSRAVPDGKDVNRSFPGNMRGSLASRVARILTKKILPHVDFGIDFHTGGASRYNYPQIRYSKTDVKARELAKTFGAPFTIQKPLLTRSLRKAAKDINVPIIVYEGGESVRLDGFAISKGVAGLKRILHAHEMIPAAPTVLHPMTHFKSTGWVRATQSGIFIWSRSSGVKVLKGEPLGMIKDPQGLRSTTVLARQTGYIIGHNNASVVNHGDALFNIGYNAEVFV